MDTEAAQQLAGIVGSADLDVASRDVVEATAVAIRRLIAWCHSRQVAVARRLAEVDGCPQAVLAQAGRVGLGEADRIVERARTVTAMPSIDGLLAEGSVTAQHVDILTRALRQLDSSDSQAALIIQAGRLGLVARHASAPDFQRTVNDAVAAINRQRGDTGEERLARQRASARVRTFIGRDDGMWNIRGTLDPATGVLIDGRLQAVCDTLFAAGLPTPVPNDTGERSDHLRALAFIELVKHGADAGLTDTACDALVVAGAGAELSGDGDTAGRAANAREPHGTGARAATSSVSRNNPAGGSTPDVGSTSSRARTRWRSDTLIVLHAPATPASPNPAATNRAATTTASRMAEELKSACRPALDDTGAVADAIAYGELRADTHVIAGLVPRAVAELVHQSHVDTVVVDDEHRVHSVNGRTHQLNIGRTQHIANRPQRLALRAIYPSCAIPHCTVAFNHCSIHHIVWWRHGGHTDLANLVPLCSRHHHDVHDNGWHIDLNPDRQIRVTLPDRTVLAGRPPPPPG
jgi:hypothetical protein